MLFSMLIEVYFSFCYFLFFLQTVKSQKWHAQKYIFKITAYLRRQNVIAIVKDCEKSNHEKYCDILEEGGY